MKKNHSVRNVITIIVCIITLTVTLIGNIANIQAATIKISNKALTLEIGKTKTIKVFGIKKKVTWWSSKKSVATVSSSGKIMAKSAGVATITASVLGKRLTCKVTITPPISTYRRSSMKVVGYYAAWSRYSGFTPDELDVSKLTHINYAFANIGSDLRIELGYPDIDSRNIYELNLCKKMNPKLKTLIAIGGWSWSGRFSDVALTETSRSDFADSCVDFIVKYGFDGIDIDWEYPVSGGLPTNKRRLEDKHNFTLLIKNLRQKLDARGVIDGKDYLLTFAGAAGAWYVNNTELDKLSQYVDFANVMTYDIHGTWDQYTDFNAPLYKDKVSSSIQYKWSVDSSISKWVEAGFPKDKIVMGVPFYGYIYKAVSNTNNGLYQSYSGGSSISYENIVKNYLNKPGYIRYFNQESKVPWLFNGSTFITYDDQQSIASKARYIKDKGLGGAMVWELSQDPNRVLLNSIYKNLK